MKTPFLTLAVLMAGCLVESANGQTPWTVVYDSDRPLNAVAHGGGQFIAVGDSGTVLTAPTGDDWTPRTTPGPADALQCVVHGDGLWVVGARTTGVLTSPDGLAWTRVQGSPTNLTALVYSAGIFVGVGRSRLWSSTNGVEWASVDTEGSVADQVLAVGGGRFVAREFIPGNRLLTSSNGLDWVKQPGPSLQSLYSIVYGDGRYLAIDTSNQAFTTSDLESWTPGGKVLGLRPSAAAHGMGIFVVAGGGDPEMSVDGSAWTFGGRTRNFSTRGVAFGNGTFVAVSHEGIIRSTQWLFVGTPTPGNLSILGPGGGRYGIEARESFAAGTAWAPVGEVTVGTNAVTWSDPDASSRPARLYRAVGP